MKYLHALVCLFAVSTAAHALDLDASVKTLDGSPVLNTIITGGKTENAPPLKLRDALMISTLTVAPDTNGRPPGMEEQLQVALLHEKIHDGKEDTTFSPEDLVLLKKQVASRGFNAEQFLSIIRMIDPTVGHKTK